MLRKPSGFIVLQGGRSGKPEGPQPPENALNTRRMPRSIAATFQTSEHEVVAIINERFDAILAQARRAA